MSRGAERDAADMSSGMSHVEPGALTSELRDRLRYGEGQLEAERQAHAEARRLLAAALERIPAIEAPETAAQEPEGEDPAPISQALRRAHSVPGGGGCSGRESLRVDANRLPVAGRKL
jgi:hypothetical protein